MREGEYGLSLLELIVALTIFITLVSGLSEVLNTSADTHKVGMTAAAVEGRARRAIDTMASHLLDAGIDTLVPIPAGPFGSTNIMFQKPLSYENGNVVWSQPYRFLLQPDVGEPTDGIDNDGDGLTDEQQLLLITGVGSPEQATVAIGHGIPPLLEGEVLNGLDDNGNGLTDEPGFVVVLVDDMLTLRLTVQGLGAERRLMERTVQTSVTVRNR